MGPAWLARAFSHPTTAARMQRPSWSAVPVKSCLVCLKTGLSSLLKERFSCCCLSKMLRSLVALLIHSKLDGFSTSSR